MKRVGILSFLILTLLVISYDLLMTQQQQQCFFLAVFAFTPVMMRPATNAKTTITPFNMNAKKNTITTATTTSPFDAQQQQDSSNSRLQLPPLLLHSASCALDAVERHHVDDNQRGLDDVASAESRTDSTTMGSSTKRPSFMERPKTMMMETIQGMTMMLLKSTTNGISFRGYCGGGDDGADIRIVREKKAGLITSIALAMTLMVSAAFSSPDMAFAATSGGRMGGSFSRPSSSSRIIRSPSSSSRSGSYSRGGPSRSSSSYSRSGALSSFSYHHHDYGKGGTATFAYPSVYDHSRTVITSPTVIVTPAPYDYVTPTPPAYPVYSGVGNWFGLASVNCLILLLLLKSNDDDADDDMTLSRSTPESALGSGTSVIQVSVALHVPDREDSNSILNVLGRLSETSKTDTRVGVQHLTREVALQLLRKKSSIISAHTRYEHFDQPVEAEREYNQLSIRERAKFEHETISKYCGVDYSNQASSANNMATTATTTTNNNKMMAGKHPNPTLAVVTILLSLDGDRTKVPKITNMRDVQKSLQMIASDAMVGDCLLSAEILWTPEAYDDALTARDVITDYPELTPL